MRTLSVVGLVALVAGVVASCARQDSGTFPALGADGGGSRPEASTDEDGMLFAGDGAEHGPCVNLECKVVDCSASRAPPTTVSGIVRDPRVRTRSTTRPRPCLPRSSGSTTPTPVRLRRSRRRSLHYTFNTPVGLPAGAQCGKVLFSDFHVVPHAVMGGTFPAECDASPMTPQEKALEFMLFDLSSCVQQDSLPPVPPKPVL